MDCVTAKLVWNHPGGFIEGLKAHLPDVLPELTRLVEAFVKKTPHPFDSEVKRQAGDGGYYIEHANTEDDPVAISIHDVVGDVTARNLLQKYLSGMFEQKIVLGNICCGSCVISGGPIEDEQMFAIQMTAVNLDPENLPN